MFRCFLSFCIFTLAVVTSVTAQAQMEHHLLRRVAVFPIGDANYSNSEDAWWQMREVLTKDQRFFVASRRFMVNRGVFQPREALKPADAIILGKILDAQALVTSYIDDRIMHMLVYDGENGYVLWQGDAEFHPAMPINDQIIRVSTQLMNQFVAAIPYQGYEITDDVIGKPVWEDNNQQLALVEIGPHAQIAVGDQVQWVTVTGDISKPFLNNAKVVVIAEGVVKEIKGDKATVRVDRAKDMADLKNDALVRFPKEVNRLKEMFANEGKSANLTSEYLSSEMKDSREFSKDHSATTTSLMWIGSMAAMVLLAF
jgi:hypothetical protein